MAKFTVTVPFPYSARVGGSGTSPRTITIDADNANAAATKLVGFGIPFAAASGFTYKGYVAPPTASLAEQGGLTRRTIQPTSLGDISPAEGTVAGGTLGQANLVPDRTEFGKTLLGGLIQDPRGTRISTPGTEQGVVNSGVIDPVSIRRALAALQAGSGDPASISNLAVTTPSGIIPPPSDFDPAAISDLAARTGTGLSDADRDSQEADQFAANERIRLQKIRDDLAAAAAATETEVVPPVLPTGVVEPLGPQSADLEALIAAELAMNGSLSRQEALALGKLKRGFTIGGSDDADLAVGDPAKVAIPETDAEKAARLAAEAKAAIDAGTSADANLTLAPDTLEFQRAQFLQGLRNRGLGDSGVAGQARRDAFNQANTRNIFENVFNRGVNEDRGQGLSAFVGDSNNALLGAGARDQAQNQFQQALDLSRGFNPAGTGFDTQGLTTLQQDILNPQGAGQAGLLNELAQQTARKKFGVGAEFLGRRNFADEFFGQDRGTSNTFAEHLNNRLFGGRF
jgi:hypothetical protein